MSDIPPKKPYLETNFKQCIICQGEKSGPIVNEPGLDSYKKVLEYIDKRAVYKEEPYPRIKARIGDINSSQLQEHKAVYHRDCYSKTCHKVTLDAAKKRLEKSLEHADISALTKVRGRPSIPTISSAKPNVEYSTSSPFTRSSSNPFAKDLCFFCESDESEAALHKVTSFNAGVKLKKAVDISGSQKLKVKLSSAIESTDALSIDVKYHLKCWLKDVEHVLTRGLKSISKGSPSNQGQTEGHQHVLAEIEFFSMLRGLLAEGSILNMATIQKSFIQIREENGITYADIDRRTLKGKLMENIPEVQFTKPSNPKESELVCLKSVGDAAVQNVQESSDKNDMESLFKSAKILRQLLKKTSSEGWKYQGSFLDNDDHVPAELYSFLRWLLIGPLLNIEQKGKDDTIHRDILTVSDLIMQAFKTDRQVSYQLSKPQVHDLGG